ncbi:fibrobacter succinogenes major paralogous domain-containing protein [Ancylomarina longa]|uniref:Fibrobacter succinogenes major paralogous domain-containing protein n=1 Tax=Ancylomarina longa TaxID=2487017 RepID=A0A434AYM4_9BACT|nr:fibrobacter succinogenes major paralogous domain-containing protein [Ancylomarina longa]RUT79673.1 hypothetical protein DLK05_03015 [Ancylomarina longa]
MIFKLTCKLFIGLVFIACVACEKDNPDRPANPLNGKTSAIFNPDKSYGSVTDIDGNEYKTIVIGDQTWMAENLRTTRYRNGEYIPNVLDNEEWAALTNGAYCTYNNTSSLDTIATYGLLYNWYAVADERKIAPKGWRVPTINDWDILINQLGGDTIASYKMKEVGDLHWDDLSESDNSSGFTALPGGFRYLANASENVGFYCVWWAMPEYNETSAGFLFLFCWDSTVSRGINYKKNGFSVRCIKE